MATSDVNDCAREMMAALKREWNRSHPTLTAGGTANALTLTYTTAPPALVQGMEFAFIAAAANTAAATLNVNSLGAKDLKKPGASGPAALAGGEIQIGQVVKVAYDGTALVMTSPVPVPTNLVVDTRSIASGSGLTGGGDLSADRTLAVGAGTGIVVNADDVAVDKATQANMEAQTASKVVTADVMKHHPALPKAWAYFTVSGGVVTLQTSYGVSGITRSSAGRFVVTFSTAFSDANYAMVGSASNTSGGAGRSVMYDETQGKTSTTAGVLVCDNAGNVDATNVAVAFYGDQ